MEACNQNSMAPGALLDLYRSAFDAYLRWWSVLLPGSGCAPGPCTIPETQCPPRCECTLEWDTCEGKPVAGTLDIHNTGHGAAKFTLRAGAFRADCAATEVMPQLEPASFELAPGAHPVVRISVKVNGSFEPGREYQSTVTIAGRYEDCAQLRLRVHRVRTPCCVIDHGEIPRRIRAHNWFDHFQCEQLCFEPAGQLRQPVPPHR